MSSPTLWRAPPLLFPLESGRKMDFLDILIDFRDHFSGGSKMAFFRARQRSSEGVVRRNGCPKGCFWRVRFFSAPLRFSGTLQVFKGPNLAILPPEGSRDQQIVGLSP